MRLQHVIYKLFGARAAVIAGIPRALFRATVVHLLLLARACISWLRRVEKVGEELPRDMRRAVLASTRWRRVRPRRAAAALGRHAESGWELWRATGQLMPIGGGAPEAPTIPPVTTAGPGFASDFNTIISRIRSRVVDVRDHTAVGDGVTPGAAAFSSAFAAAGAGGTVFVPKPAVAYIWESAPTGIVDGMQIIGVGGRIGGRTLIQYTPSAGDRVVDLRSLRAVTLENITVETTHASFGGILVDMHHNGVNDAIFNRLINCCFVAASTTAQLVSLHEALTTTIRDTFFYGGAIAISGIDPGSGSYSNIAKIAVCEFQQQTVCAIRNPGDSWSITTNNFEPLVSGAAGGILQNSNTVTRASKIEANWFGDTNGSGTCIDVLAQAVKIEANIITDCANGVVVQPGSSGVTVANNRFMQFTHGVTFVAGSASSGSVVDNSFDSPTNSIETNGHLVWRSGNAGSNTNGDIYTGTLTMVGGTLPTSGTAAVHAGNAAGSVAGRSAFGDGTGWKYEWQILSGGSLGRVLLRLNDDAAEGAATLDAGFRIGGNYVIKTIEVGAADSAGAGKRQLMVAN